VLEAMARIIGTVNCAEIMANQGFSISIVGIIMTMAALKTPVSSSVITFLYELSKKLKSYPTSADLYINLGNEFPLLQCLLSIFSVGSI
jgi:hypothetical protein